MGTGSSVTGESVRDEEVKYDPEFSSGAVESIVSDCILLGLLTAYLGVPPLSEVDLAIGVRIVLPLELDFLDRGGGVARSISNTLDPVGSPRGGRPEFALTSRMKIARIWAGRSFAMLA